MAESHAGWYPDPTGDASRLRYWNGSQWTNDYTPALQGYSAQPAQQPQAQVIVTETIYTSSSGGQPRVDHAYTHVQTAYPVESSKQTLRLIAFILNIISTVAVGWLVIPLAWMIPMTVRSWGLYKGTKRNTLAFGICTLLFLNLISGILLLVSGED